MGPTRSSEIARKWNSKIGATLNKTQKYSEAVEHHHKVYPVKDGDCRARNAGKFRCMASKQMVGILVSVWVRDDLLQHISNPSVSCVGCGIMGCLKNKGSVAVRFCLHEESFCFVCCHLASGGEEGDERRRNLNAADILSRTWFSGDGLPNKILDHNQVVLFGDLNYRISFPDTKIRSLVEQKEWNILLDKDQLRFEVFERRAFEGWKEGEITFPPTYKYHPSSDEYCWFISGRKGQKPRSPAWCDRILWVGEGLKQNWYDRCELKLSDHRPVRAAFTVEVDAGEFLNSSTSPHRIDDVVDSFDLLSNESVAKVIMKVHQV
ncbi:type IV inositol polyphosphate 5-phosphatase 9-like isoform X1 [Canna indica]|uniref:Type IV inositol polyphosphate 5-phosphatase 9-like isoform X1 n=1 Tax=Canna indica TaxID=4628 RepID=A0AAQ3QTJ4_9LILI|nr:type IV inositol polyphosphate 5-phosphatase 9-like isoform X1 [Canna indica]